MKSVVQHPQAPSTPVPGEKTEAQIAPARGMARPLSAVSYLVRAHSLTGAPEFSSGQTEVHEFSTTPRTIEANRGSQGVGIPGGSGKMSFFQVEASGQSIVYVVDCSASMGQEDGLARARGELLASLNQLSAATLFQVIPYNSRAEPLCINGRTELIPANAENKRAAALLIADLRAEGSTRHQQALHRALALRPDVIFLLTDGDALKADEIVALTRFNAGKATVHTIGLKTASGSIATSALQMLANSNGGSFRSVTISP
jgi:hypothetical protein